VSQSPSPSVRPVSLAARWGSTASNSLASQHSACKPLEAPSRIFAQSLRLNPTACHVASTVVAAQPCPPDAYQILRFHSLPRMEFWTLHNSQPTFPRHLEWSKIVYGHVGQARGPVSILTCSWWGVI
jgi:hypothetical protein